MAVPTTGSAPTASTGPSTSTKNTPFSEALFAFLFPLVTFSAIAGVYLIFGSIDTALSKHEWKFRTTLMALTIIAFQRSFDKPYKILRFNAFLSGMFTKIFWFWIVIASKKNQGSCPNSLVYLTMFVALHIIRLFAQSLCIAESKNDQFVKEYLTDSFSSFGNWIYFFCLYFLPVIEFFIRGIYFPKFFMLISESYEPVLRIGLYASIIIFFAYVTVFANLSYEEDTKSFSFLYNSEILSLLELLLIIFGQICLFNPFCLVLLVVVWVFNKINDTLNKANDTFNKLNILPVVNSNPVSTV